jgi:hypothetical protein
MVYYGLFLTGLIVLSSSNKIRTDRPIKTPKKPKLPSEMRFNFVVVLASDAITFLNRMADIERSSLKSETARAAFWPRVWPDGLVFIAVVFGSAEVVLDD